MTIPEEVLDRMGGCEHGWLPFQFKGSSRTTEMTFEVTVVICAKCGEKRKMTSSGVSKEAFNIRGEYLDSFPEFQGIRFD
jgi:hypothetical protein